ncbi:unnamed protein product [Paramecium sonneborni]|uniref:Uncharacterized protein n=1 Tax=Paramecium sonneborni TaxID=65129 RepID=A0A8S1RNP5_9CILI|nr:unnamed protein product [Paramecium sonneborni]
MDKYLQNKWPVGKRKLQLQRIEVKYTQEQMRITGYEYINQVMKMGFLQQSRIQPKVTLKYTMKIDHPFYKPTNKLNIYIEMFLTVFGRKSRKSQGQFLNAKINPKGM